MAEWMEELRKLNKLREDSLISEEEYERQKAIIIPSETSTYSSKQIYQLGGLGKAISILAGIFSILSLLRLVAFASRASLLNDIKNGKFVSFDTANSADSFVTAALSLSIIVSAALLVIMIIWAWRATVNLETWGKPGRWSRGWAIGGWFTPIMFLFVPYQIISDTWKNAPREDDSGTSSSVQSNQQRNNLWFYGFIFWWAQVVFNIFGSSQSESTLDDAITGDTLLAVSGGCGIAAGILIAIAFKQMSKRHS